MRIDLRMFKPPVVKDADNTEVVYVGGTNKMVEWVHHFWPGARRRELRWGAQVSALITDDTRRVAGHSMGGTAALIGGVNHVRYYAGTIGIYTYGAKRPPRPYGQVKGHHYRIKGDVVPFLPPWWPALNCAVLDYGKMSPVKAHGPRSYYEQMEKDGVR